METILALALALLLGTSPTQNQVNTDNTPKEKEIYNPSATRLSDIIHTDLDRHKFARWRYYEKIRR